MSTIAARISSASTRVKVGTAAVAVVAAATVTPAIAQATPGFAPVTQSVGSSIVELSSLPVVPTGLNAVDAGSSAAAVAPAPVVNAIAFVAGIPLTLLSWAGDTFYTVGNFLGGESNFVGAAFISFGDTAKAAVQAVVDRFEPYEA
jgi:hypothetical protein